MDATKLQSKSHDFMTSEEFRRSCKFTADHFLEVMLNLMKNPNITSSHLFRADIFWDSNKDTTFCPNAISTLSNDDLSGFIKHMKADYRPLKVDIQGFRLQRTIVRQLVPRNQQLDKSMLQTCHIFVSYRRDNFVNKIEGDKTLVVYLPHIENADSMPWYHPPLRALAFLHSSGLSHESSEGDHDPQNVLAIYTCSFDSTASEIVSPLSVALPAADVSASNRPASENHIRTTRTLQNLLNTIHKHSTSKIAGYQKRVHHDRIIPQKAFQDTYARLKQKYAKELIRSWKEQTDVTKSVFEDLGIAAFLIELWKEMYIDPATRGSNDVDQTIVNNLASANPTPINPKSEFPGFVDIGCGNGLLVYILIQEGYNGFGFDARSRKTWSAFPEVVQKSLQELVLVPRILVPDSNTDQQGHLYYKMVLETINSPTDKIMEAVAAGNSRRVTRFATHNGIFPAGTFIISNHADELTPWTPLVARINNSPFISIPCCSHDLSGAKWRFGNSFLEATSETKTVRDTDKQFDSIVNVHEKDAGAKADNKNEEDRDYDAGNGQDSPHNLPEDQGRSNVKSRMAAEQTPHVLSIPKTDMAAQRSNRPPSAYATLCGYVEHLSNVLGYEPEREVLRIPSTRNICIAARRQRQQPAAEKSLAEREDEVRFLLETEMRMPIEDLAKAFLQRAGLVWNGKCRGH